LVEKKKVNKMSSDTFKSALAFTFASFISLFSMTVGYTPSQIVRAGHNIPHLNYKLHEESNHFNLKSFSSLLNSKSSDTYVVSLITFPAIFLAAGVLALFIFVFVIFTRCCCACSKCAHSEEEVEAVYEVSIQHFILLSRTSGAHFSLLIFSCMLNLIDFVPTRATILRGRRK
jgi:hypothetical protein